MVRTLPAAAALATLLAGPPWALVHFVGWPLPDHLRSWAQVHEVLLGPITPTLLLDVLACLAWLAWALFTVDVARCATTIATSRRVPTSTNAGPLYRVAAVLVGTFLVHIPGQLVTPQFATSPAVPGHAAVMASTHMWSRTSAVEEGHRSKIAVVQAYDAEADVHDSLWRIAERTLEDGNRWPDIYELNRGKPQPDGGTFTRPDLIFPGEEMVLPDDVTPSPPPEPAPSTPAPPAPEPPTSTVTPAPTTAAPAQSNEAARGPGFRWDEELFVGLGLASAVSAALVAIRRRNRRRYRPGSGDRSDLPISPVVYQLRLAHLGAGQADRHVDEASTDPRPPLVVPRAEPGRDGSQVVAVGVQDGREVAIDLAAVHGLGLLGAGASAAVRALAVTALASAPAGGRLVVPEEDVPTLFGQRTRAHLPPNVRIVPDLDAALNALETEVLLRVSRPSVDGQPRPVVLVTRVPERQSRRLQAILDNGAGVGVVGLLLGQWASGVTAYVRDDGTVSATSPGPGEPLRGTSMFRLGDHHAQELLDLLLGAESDEPGTGEEPPTDANLELLNVDDHPTGASPVTADLPSDPGRVEPPGIAEVAEKPLRLAVLGPPRLWSRTGAAEREVTLAFPPRLRELLVFLAMHPEGAHRHALISALWPNGRPDKTTNALNTTLSRLRRCAVAATEGAVSEVVVAGDGRFRLNPAVVEVDYHRFAAAVARRRTATTDPERAEAYRDIVEAYTGPLADGLDAEWIESTREAVRRDAIDAVAALARALVGQDPQKTLDLLEVARSFDPHNELIYRDIMRLQERLGQWDAISRTLNLLTARLAEIGELPTEHTLALARRLSTRSDTEVGTRPAGA